MANKKYKNVKYVPVPALSGRGIIRQHPIKFGNNATSSTVPPILEQRYPAIATNAGIYILSITFFLFMLLCLCKFCRRSRCCQSARNSPIRTFNNDAANRSARLAAHRQAYRGQCSLHAGRCERTFPIIADPYRPRAGTPPRTLSEECARRHKSQLPPQVLVPAAAPDCPPNVDDRLDRFQGTPQNAVDRYHGILNERESHSTCGELSGQQSASRSMPSGGGRTRHHSASCSCSRCTARRESCRVPVYPPSQSVPDPMDNEDTSPSANSTETLPLDIPFPPALDASRRIMPSHRPELPSSHKNIAATNTTCPVPNYTQNMPKQELGLDTGSSELYSTLSGASLGNNLDYWQQHHMRESLNNAQHLAELNLRRGQLRYGSLGEENVENRLDFGVANEESLLKAGAQLELLRLQYKELWELRAKLEKKERNRLTMPDFSEQDDERGLSAICANNEQPTPSRSSSAQAPDRDPGTSHATSLESNLEPLQADDPGCCRPDLLQPPSTYKSVLPDYWQPIPQDNTSLDSLDAANTEGSSTTDASRFEQVTTTSCDSNTDNTDSASDGPQQRKLHQTRADSGYRSFETPATASRAPKLQRRSQFPLPESYEMDELATPTEQDSDDGVGRITPPSRPVIDSTSTVNARDYTQRSANYDRMASKKRLEFGRERRSEESPSHYESVNEMETYSNSDSTETLDEAYTTIAFNSGNASSSVYYNAHAGTSTSNFNTRSTKAMIMPRYMRHGSRYNSMYATPQRDYSVDEKSDALFREFSRCDPKYETSDSTRQRFHHRRLPAHRSCNTELEMVHQRRSKLSPQHSIDEQLPNRRDQLNMDPELLTGIPTIRVGHEDDLSDIAM